MNQTETSQAGEILRLVLPLMAKFDVPMTPRNYAVWYDYGSGVNEELITELNGLMAEGEAISGQHMERLFLAFVIDAELKATNDTRATLNELLDSVSETVGSAHEGFSNYEDTLSGVMSGLSDERDPDRLRLAFEALAVETRTVRECGQSLQTKLAESQREAQDLRVELAKARRQANTDPLTGVANRAVFQRALGELTRVAHNEQRSLGLLMIDIDHFKSINDNHGHLVGDRVIRFLASTMTDRVKGRDLVARYGGEEFCILLPDTDISGAMTVAENIREAMEQARLVRSGTKVPIGQVTISVGVAAYRGGEEPDELVERADQALYVSKQAGRNRVTSELAAFDGPRLASSA